MTVKVKCKNGETYTFTDTKSITKGKSSLILDRLDVRESIEFEKIESATVDFSSFIIPEVEEVKSNYILDDFFKKGRL